MVSIRKGWLVPILALRVAWDHKFVEAQVIAERSA